MKLLKDAAVQGDVSNLIIFGAYGSLPENQISPNLRYIERNPNIKFSLNIADTIWISEPYRIFKFGVKS